MHEKKHGRCAKSHCFAFVICVFLFLPFQVTLADTGLAAVLATAQQYLDQNNPKAAYRLLMPLEEDAAGNPEFDYLLGVAALEMDNAGYAIVALQRVLAMDPDFVGARVDLGRAYFNLREFTTAKLEFEKALDAKPDSRAWMEINRYLNYINNKTPLKRTQFSMLASVSGGRDTNANSATSAEKFLYFDLSPASRATPTTYQAANGRMSLGWKLTPGTLIKAGVDGRARYNQDATFVNAISLTGMAGIVTSIGKNSVSITGSGSGSRTGGDIISYASYVDTQLQRAVSAANTFGLFVRGGAIEYPGDYTAQDLYQAVMGLGLTSFYDTPGSMSGSVYLIGGKDIGRNTDSLYSSRYYGLRYSSRFQFYKHVGVLATLGSSKVNYAQQFFSLDRIDNKFDASLGLDITIVKGLDIVATVAFLKNKSEVDLYDYNRIDSSISFTWLFNR